MITFGIFLTVLSAVGFILFGLFARVVPSKKRITLIIIGLALLSVAFLGPLSKGPSKLKNIQNLDPKTINEISIMPTQYRGFEEITLVSKTLIITDENRIIQICNSLDRAENIWFPIFNKPYSWACRLEIKSDDMLIPIGLVKKNDRTKVEINSKGEYGWNYGELYSEDLGKIIEDILKTVPNSVYPK